MNNLKLIQCQPRWRVAVIHLFARLIGVMVVVEGIPFGSRRTFRMQPLGPMTGNAHASSSGNQHATSWPGLNTR